MAESYYVKKESAERGRIPVQKIMIIEDDVAIRDELALILENEGYEAVSVTDFTDVPEQVQRNSPALVLLDLGLPGRDGMVLCADIRRKMEVPIIIVTSRDSASDELKALSMGGDDYITKPYNVPVLLARVRTVLRRCGGAAWHNGYTGEIPPISTGKMRRRLSRKAKTAGGFLTLLLCWAWWERCCLWPVIYCLAL